MKKIMFVDDEEKILDVLKRFFEKYEYEVITESDGIKALEVILSSEDIDCIVFDLKMPHTSGTELAKKVKESGKDMPIVFLSGSMGLINHLEELAELGFTRNDVLMKPIDLDDVLAKIREKLRDRS